MSDSVQLCLLLVSSALVAAGISIGSRLIGRVLVLFSITAAAAAVIGLAWGGPLEGARDHPLLLALGAIAALLVVGCLALLFVKAPSALPLLAVAALPFRVPVEIGSETFNLLVPLYLVIGGAVVARTLSSVTSPPRPGPPSAGRRIDLALAAVVAIYALQAVYADDVTAATRTACFFLVPFAALYSVLVSANWDRRALLGCLTVISIEAIIFSFVGIVQAAIGEIFWNPALSASNDFHLYFRTNSLFWDPNIYGRYLALALTLIVAYLVWARRRRQVWTAVASIAFIWAGLLFAWSLSSFLALIAGLLVVIALRYSAKWALLAAPVTVAVVVAFTLVNANGQDPRGEAAAATSGRSSLVSGGLGLAGERPVFGWGSGSFPDAFARREGIASGQTSVSHNEAITVLAEQGVLGFLVFVGACALALWTLFGGFRRLAPGLGGVPPDGASALVALGSRIAVAAGFALLLVHSMGYAGLLTDPLTWAVLACGAALAADGRAGSSR